MASEQKRSTIFGYLRKRADIICLQETHSSVEDEALWRNQWGGLVFFSHGNTQSRGVMILIKNSMFANCTRVKKDEEGRVLSVSIKIDEKRINIIAIYAPNQDSPEFFSNLHEYIDADVENTLLLGDFNVTLNEKLNRCATKETNLKARNCLEIDDE